MSEYKVGDNILLRAVVKAIDASSLPYLVAPQGHGAMWVMRSSIAGLDVPATCEPSPPPTSPADIRPGDWVSCQGVLHVVASVIYEDHGQGPVAVRCRLLNDSEVEADWVMEVRR